MRNEFPEEDIDKSLRTKDVIAYKAVVDDVIVDGAVVVIDEETQLNHLNFLYVKCRTQSKDIGKKMWDEIEKLHPQTNVRETCTPYFEKKKYSFLCK